MEAIEHNLWFQVREIKGHGLSSYNSDILPSAVAQREYTCGD